jgi:hypothetical protein
MGFVSCLRGIGSGLEYPPDTAMSRCPIIGRPVPEGADVVRQRVDGATAVSRATIRW